MNRVSPWVLLVMLVLFVGLGVWSFMDENWSGTIVSAVLAGLSIGLLAKRMRTP